MIIARHRLYSIHIDHYYLLSITINGHSVLVEYRLNNVAFPHRGYVGISLAGKSEVISVHVKKEYGKRSYTRWLQQIGMSEQF